VCVRESLADPMALIPSLFIRILLSSSSTHTTRTQATHTSGEETEPRAGELRRGRARKEEVDMCVWRRTFGGGGGAKLERAQQQQAEAAE
jgi:hypothetical protein